MQTVKVVATTCHNVHHALLRRLCFDVCIVDEASQVTHKHTHTHTQVGRHTAVDNCRSSQPSHARSLDHGAWHDVGTMRHRACGPHAC